MPAAAIVIRWGSNRASSSDMAMRVKSIRLIFSAALPKNAEGDISAVYDANSVLATVIIVPAFAPCPVASPTAIDSVPSGAAWKS